MFSPLHAYKITSLSTRHAPLLTTSNQFLFQECSRNNALAGNNSPSVIVSTCYISRHVNCVILFCLHRQMSARDRPSNGREVSGQF